MKKWNEFNQWPERKNEQKETSEKVNKPTAKKDEKVNKPNAKKERKNERKQQEFMKPRRSIVA